MKSLIAAFGLFILILMSPLSLAVAQMDDNLMCGKVHAVEAKLRLKGLAPIGEPVEQPNGNTVQIWSNRNGDEVFVGLYHLHPSIGMAVCVLAHWSGLNDSGQKI